ncbi:MAG TPA: ABC transporter permease, partial [Thermoanaerobaculia bacterium]|nr:ABC transporter permease [Thermoanaerobaculia bacterium]
MHLRSFLLQFLRDVRSQKLRTFLTVFGIVWGTAAVTLLLAFGQGLEEQIIKSQKGLGENIVICWPARTSKAWAGNPKGRRIRVTEADIAMLRSQVPEIKAISGEFQDQKSGFKVGRKTLVPQISATSPVFAVMRNIIPQAGGRYLDRLDMKQRRRVVFLGNELKDDLFGDQPAVGHHISIGSVPFLVVGVMEKKS